MLAIFCSQSLLHFLTLAKWQQPEFKFDLPLSGSLLQHTLLFDRRFFFDQHRFSLIFSARRSEFGQDFFQYLPNYYERMLFQHWGGYVPHPERAQALLRYYFCTRFLELNAAGERPMAIEWQVVDPHTGNPDWRVIAKCVP